MKKKTADKPVTLVLVLSNNERCEFIYSSVELAKTHYDQLKTAGVFCGFWITKLEIE